MALPHRVAVDVYSVVRGGDEVDLGRRFGMTGLLTTVDGTGAMRVWLDGI
jgi:hypothetical protein